MIHDLDDIVTLDFESYYAADYSLTQKTMNTSGYVWDDRFKAQCIGVCDGTKDAVWYGPEDIERAIKKHAIDKRPIAAHNAHFDGFILSQRYGVVPPFYYDTLSMARALHGFATRHNLDTIARLYGLGVKTEGLLKTKGVRDLDPETLEILGEYCCNDTELCRDVLAIQVKNFPHKELRLVDWTIRAFCDPVLRLNQDLVKEEYDAQLADIEAKQKAAATDAMQLLSAEKFALMLEALGVEVPLKMSPSTGQLTYAFAKSDKAFTELLEHDDPRVVALVEARLATKSTIGVTRAKRFMDIGDRKLPMAYNYVAAHTTRFGGSNKMNMQNLERQGYLADGKTPDMATARLRRSIEAPADHMVVVRDSMQIEPRTNGWLWGQEDLVDAFRQFDAGTGPDVYRVQARKTYGVPLEEITKDQRFLGKVQTIALGYQMGWRKYQATLEGGALGGPPVIVSDQEAQRDVYGYRDSNKQIVGGWELCERILLEMAIGKPGEYKCLAWEKDTLWLPNGLPMHYTELYGVETDRGISDFTYLSKNNGKRSKIYGGLLTENIVQALARIIVSEQLLLVQDAGWRVVGMTHDEVIAIAHKTQADRCLDDMAKAMSITPAWCRDLPINSDGGYAFNYSK
ncbi:DNA polymerase [Caldimonas sp. KR1-144]|uniref:DNA polymerase n=1 Tax=Caldimonas sp. KR1-144 TaxID=3400911 RepID=UPI003C022D28